MGLVQLEMKSITQNYWFFLACYKKKKLINQKKFFFKSLFDTKFIEDLEYKAKIPKKSDRVKLRNVNLADELIDDIKTEANYLAQQQQLQFEPLLHIDTNQIPKTSDELNVYKLKVEDYAQEMTKKINNDEVN